MGARRDRLPPFSLNARFRWDLVRSVMSDRQPASVLEFGAGKGAMGSRLARSARYVGVEPDERSRAAATAAVSSWGGTVVADVAEIGPDLRFEMVCAFEVLEHLDDDGGALRDWCDRLTNDGFVLLSVPAHRARFGQSDVRVGHLRRYDRTDVVRLVSEAGLQLDAVWSTGWPIGRVLEKAWNLAARLRPSRAPTDSRSSESGRWFQPSGLVAPLWVLVSVPSVWLQRRRFQSDAGTGWVILCHRVP